MILTCTPDGSVKCLYTEALDLAAIGPLAIRRASEVEPLPDGRWIADLARSGGPILGPFERRSEAIGAEIHYLETRVL